MTKIMEVLKLYEMSITALEYYSQNVHIDTRKYIDEKLSEVIAEKLQLEDFVENTQDQGSVNTEERGEKLTDDEAIALVLQAEEDKPPRGPILPPKDYDHAGLSSHQSLPNAHNTRGSNDEIYKKLHISMWVDEDFAVVLFHEGECVVKWCNLSTDRQTHPIPWAYDILNAAYEAGLCTWAFIHVHHTTLAYRRIQTNTLASTSPKHHEGVLTLLANKLHSSISKRDSDDVIASTFKKWHHCIHMEFFFVQDIKVYDILMVYTEGRYRFSCQYFDPKLHSSGITIEFDL
jgi:hypothetical protein